MNQCKVGLVGIGKLGNAMMQHWNKNNLSIGIYHPSITKAELFLQQFKNGYILTGKEFTELDVLILALPAKEVIPFISNLMTKDNSFTPTVIVNMATALNTEEIKNKFPSLNVLGVKYMGHGRDLLEHGNGLFITESSLPKGIEQLFQHLGQVKIDREDCLIQVNRLATYYALKTAINIENEFTQKGFSPDYIKRALTSIAPEVIRSYSEGSLGHFAKEIVKDIQLENVSEVD
jgi:hypothetical protein